MTASDSSHFRSACQLLASIEKEMPGQRVIFWDLGLASIQKNMIAKTFEFVTLVEFPFADYPAYFSLRKKSGCYAWKPLSLHLSGREHNGVLIWLDAGNIVLRDLSFLDNLTRRFGFYSPPSTGLVKDLTHIETQTSLDPFGKTWNETNLNGAIVAFDLCNPASRNLLTQWREKALEKQIICPDGAQKSNHRFDQSIVTILRKMNDGLEGKLPSITSRSLGILIHQDIG